MIKIELQNLKEDRRISSHTADDLLEQRRSAQDKLKDSEYQISRLLSEQQANREQLNEMHLRIEEGKLENNSIKQEREKVYYKIDLLNEENSNLRNEVYMMKKLMLEYDKRSIHHQSPGTGNNMGYLEHTPNREHNPRFNRSDDFDRESEYPERRDQQTKESEKPSSAWNSRAQGQRDFRSPSRPTEGKGNILTWNQPYDSRSKLTIGDDDMIEQKKQQKDEERLTMLENVNAKFERKRQRRLRGTYPHLTKTTLYKKKNQQSRI